MDLDPGQRELPGRFWLWLAASAFESLGTQVVTFGIAWTALGQSASLAGALLAAATVPRLLLAVLGGSTADRRGPLRVSFACGLATLLIAAAGVAFGGAGKINAHVLFPLVIALGVVSAYYIPASGAMPRMLVQSTGLQRAMASWQVVLQVTTVAAAPLGGLIVSFVGLRGSFIALGITTCAMLSILAALRQRLDVPQSSAAHDSYFERIKDGFRVVVRERVIRDLALLLVAVAGFLIPVTSLLIPSLARQNGWSAETAGLTAAGYTIGGGLVSIVVMVRGGAGRAGRAAMAGLLLASVGIGLLAVAPTAGLAAAFAAIAGAGTSTFTSHAGPILMGSAPQTYLARVQAILFLAQSLPLLFANAAIGFLADWTSARTAAIVCSLGIGIAALGAASSPYVKSARNARPRSTPAAVPAHSAKPGQAADDLLPQSDSVA